MGEYERDAERKRDGSRWRLAPGDVLVARRAAS